MSGKQVFTVTWFSSKNVKILGRDWIAKCCPNILCHLPSGGSQAILPGKIGQLTPVIELSLVWTFWQAYIHWHLRTTYKWKLVLVNFATQQRLLLVLSIVKLFVLFIFSSLQVNYSRVKLHMVFWVIALLHFF